MFCIKCGEQIDATAKFCKSCGAATKTGTTKKSRVTIFILTILLAAGSGFGIHQYITNETAFDRPVIGKSVSEKKSITNGKKEIIKASQKKVYTIITDNGIGSGFLFNNDGMVVTNAHVVAGFTDVLVRNSEGVEEPGRVIGISDIEDIAVIEVDSYKGQKPLPMEMEVTDVGSEVIALGSPNGFENSASIGYLTGVDRDISFDFEYEDIYQIDAQIAPGSSGGPLIDAETGKVIGINSLLYTDGNAIGFSIPLHSVHDSLMAWINNPMSASAVASVFGVYESYDYFDWLEDYNYEDETVYDYDSEPAYEEEEIIVSEEPVEYEEEAYDDYETYDNEDYSYEDETFAEEDYPEDGQFEEEIVSDFDEQSMMTFVQEFRYYYETALAYEDFSYVSDMLLYESEIYQGIADYIYEISGQGMIFDFIDTTIIGTEIQDGYALVHTYESFDFMNAAGEWTLEERNKTYTIVVDEYGWYQISDIVND